MSFGYYDENTIRMIMALCVNWFISVTRSHESGQWNTSQVYTSRWWNDGQQFTDADTGRSNGDRCWLVDLLPRIFST